MRKAVHTEVAKTSRTINRRLIFGVLAAPVGWLIHEMTGVAIIGRGCQQGGQLAAWQWTVLALITVLAVGLALAGTVTAYRVFRQRNREGRITQAEGWDKVEYIAMFGLIASGFLLLNIIYFGVMPMVVEPCLRAI